MNKKFRAGNIVKTPENSLWIVVEQTKSKVRKKEDILKCISFEHGCSSAIFPETSEFIEKYGESNKMNTISDLEFVANSAGDFIKKIFKQAQEKVENEEY